VDAAVEREKAAGKRVQDAKKREEQAKFDVHQREEELKCVEERGTRQEEQVLLTV
jgi:hypothetical protein